MVRMAAKGKMPTLATGSPDRSAACRQQGLSLLEVLVVLAIVGVMLAALTLSLGGGESRRLENSARRAEALIRLACDRAAFSGTDMGIAVAEDRLRFGMLDGDGWHPIVAEDPADPLRPRALGENLRLSLYRQGRRMSPGRDPGAAEAQLVCLGTGELTPFELRVDASDEAAGSEGWLLRGQADGRLELSEVRR